MFHIILDWVNMGKTFLYAACHMTQSNLLAGPYYFLLLLEKMAQMF